MENLFWIGFIGAIVAGLFAVMQARKVMAYSEGTERMRKIAANIRAGANAYLKQQYTTLQIHPLRLRHRRHLFHAGRLHRHEDRNQLQRPHRPGRL